MAYCECTGKWPVEYGRPAFTGRGWMLDLACGGTSPRAKNFTLRQIGRRVKHGNI